MMREDSIIVKSKKQHYGFETRKQNIIAGSPPILSKAALPGPEEHS
jgi:hypothetical protein